MGALFSGRCRSKARLDGKTAIVTGSNTGIGRVTVEDFVSRGCRVIMACRDLQKAEKAAAEVRLATAGVEGAGSVLVHRLDLASLASVRDCAQNILTSEPQIHILVNNAGIMACPKGLTEDGFEMQFGVNHLGHFLFTCLLLPRIRSSAPSRIVTVSSFTHVGGSINFEDLMWENSYNPSLAYTRSKLANVIFSKELGDRLQGTGVTTYCLNPGVVATELGRHFDTAFFPGVTWMFNHLAHVFCKTPALGAQTSIYCALEESLASETGLYYSDCKRKAPSSKAQDRDLCRKLWDVSASLAGLGDWDPFTAEDNPPSQQYSF